MSERTEIERDCGSCQNQGRKDICGKCEAYPIAYSFWSPAEKIRDTRIKSPERENIYPAPERDDTDYLRLK